MAPWALDVIDGLCGEQLRRGHDVRVVSTTAGQHAVDFVKRTSPHAVEIEYFPVDAWAERSGVRVLRRFAFSSALARELRRSIARFDLVHLHYIFAFSSLCAASICRQRGVPYVVSLYGNLDPYMHAKNRALKDTYLQLFGRRALNGAATIHLISEGERQMVRPFRLTARQTVVDLGLNTSRYLAGKRGIFRDAYPAVGSRKIVLYLGRISYTKGLDLLAEAFTIVAASDSNVHLVLVGPDDEGYGERIRILLRRQSLLDRVTFTGRVSERDKISALMDADIFAFPSYTEALGIAMLEAMACELPVVLTERAALAGEMAAEGAAWVVKSDAKDLAAGLRTLLDDAGLRRRLGSSGRSLVTSRFSWPAVTDRFLDVYRSSVPLVSHGAAPA